jgi:hypothetical protein
MRFTGFEDNRSLDTFAKNKSFFNITSEKFTGLEDNRSKACLTLHKPAFFNTTNRHVEGKKNKNGTRLQPKRDQKYRVCLQ